ncbi:MAG: protein kinase [Christensenella sp.]
MFYKDQIIENTYQVIQPIGEGGGGTIYKAYHIRLQKYVVLKLIKDKVKDKLNVRTEVDLLKSLKHTYLPQVYDFIEDGDDVFTVLDFVEGMSFDKILNNGITFPPSKIFKWARQLCEALVYLHTQSPPVIHSDIKPANIMRTLNDDVCLIDFNVSLLLGGTGNIGYSRGYSPPELFDEDSTEIQGVSSLVSRSSSVMAKDFKANVRCDIYSLGATLYHMVTGQKPLRGNYSPLSQIRPQFPQAFAYIIDKAMSTNPAKRYQSAEEMLHALTNISKLDNRYKRLLHKQVATMIVCGVCFVGSLAAMFSGYWMFNSERNEKYFGYISQAQQLLKAGKFDDAIKISGQAIDMDKNKPAGYQTTALIYYQSGNYDETISFLKGTLENDYLKIQLGSKSDYADLFYILANSFYKKADFISAKENYEKAISYFNSSKNYYRDYSCCLAQIGLFEEAATALQQFEAISGEKNEADYIRGEIGYCEGNFVDAASYLSSALSGNLEPELESRAVMLLAKSYKNSGNLQACATTLEKYTASPFSSYEMQETLAMAYTDMGQTQQAIDTFYNLIESGYARAYLYHNIAILYQSIGEFTAAENALNEMIALEPNGYKAYMQQAFLFAQRQRDNPSQNKIYSRVVECYNKAEELYNDYLAKGNADDPQMKALQGMMADLKANGWI